MAILSIDQATKCGWAVRDDRGRITSGVVELDRFKGICRWQQLWGWLDAVCVEYCVTKIVHERPIEYGQRPQASRVLFGAVSIIELFCSTRKIPCNELSIATVKKHATGKGNAKKAAMVKAAQKKWPEANIVSDNEADARWILDLFTSQLFPGG